MNLSVEEQKNKIRQLHKKIRAALDIKNLSKIIIGKVVDLDEFKKAENIFCYISFGSETDTSEILSITGKNIFVPKISDNEMYMTKYTPQHIKYGKFGILEPEECCPVKPSVNDVIIVPALACDTDFHRIGYGKGFYDKYMKDSKAVKILPVPSKLIISRVPSGGFDVPVDIIVTEKNIYRRF